MGLGGRSRLRSWLVRNFLPCDFGRRAPFRSHVPRIVVPDPKLQQSSSESRTCCSYRCPEGGANEGEKASDATESQDRTDLPQSADTELAFQRDFFPGVQLDADRDDFRSWLAFFGHDGSIHRKPTILVNRFATAAGNSKMDGKSRKLRT